MATISGTVKDEAGNFAARMVRAYRRSDGALAGQIVSNATTGAYSITTLDGTEHFAIVHDGVVTAGDPYWNNVVLAMHMDDVGLTDVKGHAVTLNGNASRSAAQSKFGGYSAYLDGTGDYITVPSGSDFAFGTGDFTVEFWFMQTVAGSPFLIDCRPTSSTNGAYVTTYINAGTVAFYTNAAARITSSAITTGAWYHVAVCRSGTSTRLFLNGTQTGSTYTDPTNYIASPVSIGASGNGLFPLTGYFDDIRITKGVARYTANFTPPAAAFPHGFSIGAPTTNALIFDNITPV